jgi:hypothetical protein
MSSSRLSVELNLLQSGQEFTQYQSHLPSHSQSSSPSSSSSISYHSHSIDTSLVPIGTTNRILLWYKPGPNNDPGEFQWADAGTESAVKKLVNKDKILPLRSLSDVLVGK